MHILTPQFKPPFNNKQTHIKHNSNTRIYNIYIFKQPMIKHKDTLNTQFKKKSKFKNTVNTFKTTCDL